MSAYERIVVRKIHEDDEMFIKVVIDTTVAIHMSRTVDTEATISIEDFVNQIQKRKVIIANHSNQINV